RPRGHLRPDGRVYPEAWPRRTGSRTPTGNCTEWPSAAPNRRSAELVPGGAVDVRRNLALVPVAGADRAGGLEHQDRPAGGRGPVLDALRHHVGVTAGEMNGGLGPVRGPYGDVECPVQDQEELVRALMRVPNMVA